MLVWRPKAGQTELPAPTPDLSRSSHPRGKLQRCVILGCPYGSARGIRVVRDLQPGYSAGSMSRMPSKGQRHETTDAEFTTPISRAASTILVEMAPLQTSAGGKAGSGGPTLRRFNRNAGQPLVWRLVWRPVVGAALHGSSDKHFRSARGT